MSPTEGPIAHWCGHDTVTIDVLRLPISTILAVSAGTAGIGLGCNDMATSPDFAFYYRLSGAEQPPEFASSILSSGPVQHAHRSARAIGQEAQADPAESADPPELGVLAQNEAYGLET